MRADIKEALDQYAATGMPLGSFLMSVLKNDLTQAVGRADDDNLRGIREIVQYVYNELPGTCWGSPDEVKAWIKKHQEKAVEPTPTSANPELTDVLKDIVSPKAEEK